MPVTGRTRIFGIVADPIHHVKTPEAFNRLLEAEGVDGVMVPVHVSPSGLGDMLDGFRAMRNFGGFIVTVPHKTPVVDLCDELVGDAAQVGAVNCIRREPDGRLVGAILDGVGFVEGLRRAGIEPKGMRAYLAGAGGAAAAIAFALAEAGVSSLTVSNRTVARADALRDRVAAAYPALDLSADATRVAAHDLVVNATSLGMKDGDPLPVDVEQIHDGQVVAEIIMEPAMTPLLDAAQARGCRIHRGMAMLQAQIVAMARHMGALQ